ncbi:hypothetical protein CSW63_05020 [Caulobacter sp. FWC26]|nr:hypothetical protein CSW63_05020 [Caulobacter sp. FWC26]
MYRDRHGKIRWRFRKAGQQEAQTSAEFGSSDWWDWYRAALSSAPRQIGSERSSPGSFNALIVAFYQSSQWQLLRPETQRSYRGEIERFRAEDGQAFVRDLKPQHIKRMMDLKAATPNAANNLLRILRVLMAFAVERGWRDDNPAKDVKRLRIRSEGFHTWSEAEIAKFEARWPVGTNERLAFDLLLYTGQRSGDVRLMTRAQVKDGTVSLRQSKTDEALVIPVHPALDASLHAAAGDHLVLITTQYGRPFTAKGFSNWIAESAGKAGLSGCTAHGLRKSAAVRLADAGCTPHEIMAITGHRSLKEVQRYTAATNQRANAEAAMKKFRRTDSDQKLSNRSKKLDKKGDI